MPAVGEALSKPANEEEPRKLVFQRVLCKPAFGKPSYEVCPSKLVFEQALCKSLFSVRTSPGASHKDRFPVKCFWHASYQRDSRQAAIPCLF